MTLNEAYEEYARTGDIDPLYPLVKQRATQAVVSVLHRAAPEELVVTLTTNVLMDIAKFKPGKSAFASWVFLKAKHDCMDELKRGEAPYIDPVTNPELLFALDWLLRVDERITQTEGAGCEASECIAQLRAELADEGTAHFQRWAFDADLNPPVDAKVVQSEDELIDLYTRIETVLDSKDKELVRLKFEGREDAEVAELVQMPVGTMKRKYHEIKEKLRKAA